MARPNMSRLFWYLWAAPVIAIVAFAIGQSLASCGGGGECDLRSVQGFVWAAIAVAAWFVVCWLVESVIARRHRSR